MTGSSTTQWTLILSLTALLLSVAVLAQIISRYTAAYLAAPQEIAAFVDAVDSSISENESYDRDVTRLQRLEDKLRLGRLLQEIQRGGDDLREELNGLLVGEDDSRLRIPARLLWANKRVKLEERVRRLDLLRMRFLVIYMSIVAGASGEAAAKQQQAASKEKEKEKEKERDLEKAALRDHHNYHHERAVPRPGHLPRSLTEAVPKKLPFRRLTTQAIGHQENNHMPVRMGWAGVVKELQLSPRMHKRHASIERSMSETPASSP